ncbi:MAG: monovalent cation/H+ antiporter complex subunit F [Defluviitaleaceae bacterium]|nr:monovalent cation/H+ antiporter complex subunit F [Defluviitaleaceae bacterium]
MYMIWILIGLLVLYIVRAVLGPSIWDRLLAMNLISTKIIVIIVVLASAAYGGLAFLLDFAIIYALSGFMGTIFIALFLSDRKLGKRRSKKQEK